MLNAWTNMLNVIMLSVIMLKVIMLSIKMLIVIMLSVILPSVIIPSVILVKVIMLSVIMPCVIILSVIMPSVIMLNVIMLKVTAPRNKSKFRCQRSQQEPQQISEETGKVFILCRLLSSLKILFFLYVRVLRLVPQQHTLKHVHTERARERETFADR